MNALTTIDPAIAAFAAAVRAALDDLTPEEIDDLTDGLEADLSDQAADGDAPALGDPAAYADELRAAAGLPPRNSTKRTPLIDAAGMRAKLDEFSGSVRRYIRDRPALAGFLGFFASLAPLWWIFRGAIVVLVVGNFINIWSSGSPYTFAAVVVAMVLVSIQWGRGRWMPRPWVRGVRTATSVLAVLTIPFIIAILATAVYGMTLTRYEQEYFPRGLTNGEEQVTNIFAYDADGNPLVDVQLFDQNGNPLSTFDAAEFGEEYFTTSDDEGYDNLWLIRRLTASSMGGWNVYPLQTAKMDGENGFGAVGEAPLPFDRVSPLLKLAPDEMLEMSPSNVPEG